MLEVTRFLLVSIVVPDLDKALDRYHTLFGLEPSQRRPIPEMAVEMAVLPLDSRGYAIELVAPSRAAPQDPAARQSAQSLAAFLDRRGPGIHHLTFEVADFDAAVAHLEDRGAPTSVSEVQGDKGTHPLAVVHPRSCRGVMFELLPPGAFVPEPAEPGSSIFRRFLNTSCVTQDLDHAVATYADLFGFTATQEATVPEMAVRSAIFTIGGDDVLESFAPLPAGQRSLPRYSTDAEAALDKFLERRKEGPYRLALEVHDYEATLGRLDAQSVPYVPFDLELDTGPLRVAVVSPRATTGVMFEVCEPGNAAYKPFSSHP